MVTALIAAGIALVAVAVIAVAVIAVRRRGKTDELSVKRDIASIDSVGVHSTLSDEAKAAASAPMNREPSAHSTSSAGQTGASLAPRFAAMGALTAGVFGVLAARLWSMQVMDSSSYSALADRNKFATMYTPAPRGRILDAGGTALVDNRVALTILAEGDVADNAEVVGRLSAVLGLPRGIVRARIQDASSGAQSQRVVASDVSMRTAAFIAEHSDAFPGVTSQARFVRQYPYGALAAHVLGYTGAVIQEDLDNVAAGREIKSGDEVGRSGVESTYDNFLAGSHGERKVIADAHGNVVEVVSEVQSTKGSDIRLTIQAPLQYVCDTALAKLVAPDGVIGMGVGTAAAAVVMDPRDGAILAMSSYPTYTPMSFIGGISNDQFESYQSEKSHYPLMNRAIAGGYPAASTYKAFTSLAALAYGFADTERTWDCKGAWDGWDTGQPQHCWNLNGHGPLNLREGIVNSCDVVFYEIAKDFYDASALGGNKNAQVADDALQEYIKRYRFGDLTGIDLGGEIAGRVPTPQWKAEYWADFPEAAAWRGGDSTNMVIGQGDVLATPIQMAVAYGAIATGNIMRPHVLSTVMNDRGQETVSFEPEVVSTPDVPTANLAFVRDALNGVAKENSSVRKGLEDKGLDPSVVACKTGTGEVAGKDDFAWFACYAPVDDPRFVVAVLVEEGGGGSESATPLGAEILKAAFDCEAGNLTAFGRVTGSTGESVEYHRSGESTGRTD